MNLYSDFLEQEAVVDPGRWGGLWARCPAARRQELLTLMISAVLLGACAWHQSALRLTSELPWLLLLLVEDHRMRYVLEGRLSLT